jgi:hypothetical protein
VLPIKLGAPDLRSISTANKIKSDKERTQLLMRIDLSLNASPWDASSYQHRSFLKPRESGTSPDPSLEHAVASAALAAQFKRAIDRRPSAPQRQWHRRRR